MLMIGLYTAGVWKGKQLIATCDGETKEDALRAARHRIDQELGRKTAAASSAA